MKKIIRMISLTLCLIFCCSNVTYAMPVSPEFDSSKIDEADRAQIEQLINSSTVMDIINPDSNLDSEITWGTPTKRYLDKDILLEKVPTKSFIMSVLETATYCYDISVFRNNQEIEMTFSKGLPPKEGIEDILTEEQYQQVIDNEGKWTLTSYGVVEADNISIHKALETYGLTEQNDFIILSSQNGFDYPIIIEFVDGIAEYIMPIYDSTVYPLLSDDTSIQDLTLYENGAYSFAEISTLAADYQLPGIDNNELTKENKALLWLLFFVIVFIFLLLIPGFIRKWDFKRQVNGKKPERQVKGEIPINYDKGNSTSPETDAINAANMTNARANWHSSNH